MKITTLNKIRKYSPSPYSWEKLLKHLGKTEADDEPLPFSVILASNGLADALWCCRTAPEYDKDWRLFEDGCAKQVEHLMAEAYANGGATREELKLARDAAWVAWAAEDAAQDAQDAQDATRVAWTAWTAAAAAVVAAEAAAEAAATETQTKKFLEIVEE